MNHRQVTIKSGNNIYYFQIEGTDPCIGVDEFRVDLDNVFQDGLPHVQKIGPELPQMWKAPRQLTLYRLIDHFGEPDKEDQS